MYRLGDSPLSVCEIEKCLENYPDFKFKNELLQGLKFGFKLNYTGPRTPIFCPNSKSVLENKEATKQKIDKEIALGRIAGPFLTPPFPTFRCSPLALIPKSVPGEYRLILNLSYPTDMSVNDFIDKEFCTVRYSSIDDAVLMVQRLKRGALLAKADIKSAFRLIRIWPGDFDQLGFSFDGKYFYDRCLSMGSAVGCNLFDKFSSALRWYTASQCKHENILHYLDDFLFGSAANSSGCADTLAIFQDVCKMWSVPLANDKTVTPVEILTFLGVEFNTLEMMLRLPDEKIAEIRERISVLLRLDKVSLREIQSIIGLLNFACQVIVPGRAFCRRLIDATCNVKKSWHKVRISKGMKKDLHVWLEFLSEYNGKSVMIDQFWTSNETLHLFTDSAGGANGRGGFGIYFGGAWAQSCFPSKWEKEGILKDITFLEFFPLVVAIEIWGHRLINKKLLFHIDNKAVLAILNKKSSKSKRVMVLVRRLVLVSLKYNILIKGQYVQSKMNGIADSLSRSNWQRFRNLAPEADKYPTKMPDHLWKI